jgi:hypothetical protein
VSHTHALPALSNLCALQVQDVPDNNHNAPARHDVILGRPDICDLRAERTSVALGQTDAPPRQVRYYEQPGNHPLPQLPSLASVFGLHGVNVPGMPTTIRRVPDGALSHTLRPLGYTRQTSEDKHPRHSP